jgi:hypothetical protein
MLSLESYHCHKPSGLSMALGLIEPLPEMSSRNISCGKGGRRVRITISPPAGSLNLLEPSGPVQACKGIALPSPVPLQNLNTIKIKAKIVFIYLFYGTFAYLFQVYCVFNDAASNSEPILSSCRTGREMNGCNQIKLSGEGPR